MHPTKEQPTLADVISEFTYIHPSMDDQESAWGQCDRISDLFIDYAEARGFPGMKRYMFYASRKDHERFAGPREQINPDPRNYVVTGPHDEPLKNESGQTLCTWHCIVDAGHILIDFTAKQYSGEFDCPHIIEFNEALWFVSREYAMAAKAGA